MSRLLIVAVVLLAIVTALTVGAFKLLGWWAVLVVPVVAVLFLKFVAGRLLKRLFLMPFKAKGAVLQGARVEVHEVRPANKPAPRRGEDGEEEDAGDEEADARERHYYLVEVTVTPMAKDGAFAHWEPGELRLIGAGRGVDDEDGDDVADIAEVLLHQDGVWQEDEGMKFAGPQRLRLTVGVVPEITALQFQYYFETFGQVGLPRVVQGSSVPVAS